MGLSIYFSGVNVLEDHAGCPPYVCQACISQLNRAQSIKNKKLRGVAVNFNVPSFPNPA